MLGKEKLLVGLCFILVVAPLLAAGSTKIYVITSWLNVERLTFFVLLFQVWIYWKQQGIMQAQARISEAQGRSIERLERPLLLQVAPPGPVGFKDAIDKSVFRIVEINFENYGRSPAIVDCWHVAIVVSANEPDPQLSARGHYFSATMGKEYKVQIDGEIHYRTGIDLVPYMRAVPSTLSVAPVDRLGWVDLKATSLNEGQQSEILAKTQTVWLDGVLFYSDVWDTEHKTRFRWRYDTALDIFIRAGRPEANTHT